MEIILSNGAVVTPDASVNQAELARQRQLNPEVWNTLLKFLAETDLSALPEGKTDIIPGRLWINNSEYTPKTKVDMRIEQHHNYIDLDYTLSGNEEMGIAHDVTPTDEYNPVKDVQHFASDKVDYYKTSPDVYFVFFPSDYHQPSVQADGEVKTSRRIIAKIEYVK